MARDPLDSAYATLGLAHGASFSAVKRQYKALVRKWHPDRFTGDLAGVAEATLMLKGLNRAYSAILEEHSANTTAHEPRSQSDLSRQIDPNGSFGEHLTRAQIDEMVEAINHSETLLAVAFIGDIAGWPSRVLSLSLGLIYVAGAWRSGESGRVLLACLLPLVCIWFPNVSGGFVGARITKGSSSSFVWFFGWVLLLLPMLVLGISWLSPSTNPYQRN